MCDPTWWMAFAFVHTGHPFIQHPLIVPIQRILVLLYPSLLLSWGPDLTPVFLVGPYHSLTNQERAPVFILA
jgi:hypothetical protein